MTDFSVRQVLACLNVSIFDADVESVLEHARLNEIERQNEKRNPFHGVPSLFVQAFAAFVCFWGLRAFALPAGAFLTVVCAAGLARSRSLIARYVFGAYFGAGVLLLVKALFAFAPAFAVLASGALSAAACAKPVRRAQRIQAAALFFVVCAIAVLPFGSGAAGIILSIFCMSGTIGLMFPARQIRWRETAIFFTAAPLFAWAAYDTAALIGVLPRGIPNGAGAAVCLTETALLLFALRKDAEAGEKATLILWGIAASVAASVLGGGFALSAAVFATAYFTCGRALGKVAAAVFLWFWGLFLLSLPCSFETASVIGVVSGTAFFGLSLRLKKQKREGEA